MPVGSAGPLVEAVRKLAADRHEQVHNETFIFF